MIVVAFTLFIIGVIVENRFLSLLFTGLSGAIFAITWGVIG